MDIKITRRNDNTEQREADNIFVHSYEKPEAGQQIEASAEFLQTELLGLFPSLSPTQTPTELKDNNTSEGFAATSSHVSAEEISTIFASSCPLLSFDTSQYIQSWDSGETSDSKLVKSLKKILPFKRDESLVLEYDTNVGEESLVNAVEASLVWMVVTLGLGFWLILLCILRKAATAKFEKRSSRQLPIRLRRPSFEHYRAKKYNNNQQVEKCHPGKKSEDFNENIKSNKRMEEKAIKNPSKTESWSQRIRTLQEVSSDSPNDGNLYVKTIGNVGTKAKIRGERLANDKAFAQENIVECRKRKIENFNDEGRAQFELSSRKFEELRNSAGDENNGQKYQYFIPELPIMSDLSMPPGLSKSSSSSSSSRSECDGGEASDEASVEVLATDDIYTGSVPVPNIMGTPAANYLSYCLEESESAASTRQNNQAQLDNGSDTRLLSVESINSALSESRSSSSRNMEVLRFPRVPKFEIHGIYVPGKGAKKDKIDPTQPLRCQTTSKTILHSMDNQYFHLGKHGGVDADCVGGENGKHPPLNEMKNCDIDRVVLQDRLAGQSDNLAMLLRCDDSNTTIDLLADSDSTQSSVESIDSNKRSLEHSIKSTPLIPPQEQGIQETNERPPAPETAGATSMFLSRHQNHATIEEMGDIKRFETTRKELTSREDATESSIQSKKRKDAIREKNPESHLITPMTGDLEALIFETDEETRVCGTHRIVQNGKGSAVSLHRGKRIEILFSCVLLMVSVVIFVVMGISELYRFHETIALQFDSLLDKITKPFLFENHDLYYFLDELDRSRQQLYLNLNDHCPRISSQLCGYNFDSAFASSSSCKLDGVPFSERWEKLLIASDSMVPSTASSKSSSDSISEWWVMVKNQSLSVSSTLRTHFRNEAEKWKWCLSIALTSGIGMSFLAISVLFIVLYPILEKRWNLNWKERLPYLKFGEENSRFSFCTGRIFATIFWSLFVAIWLLGMAFAVMMVATVDVCDSELPNVVLGNEFEKWEGRIPGYESYITEFWQQQLRYCSHTSTTNGPNVIYPVQLTDRIDLLSHLVGPIQNITDALENLSSSGFYPNVCGRDVASVLQAAKDMGSQVCSEAEFVTNAYLEIMSCEHSSWLPLYNMMVEETICTRGLSGLVWATVMQIVILFVSLVLWVFRSDFLVSSKTNIWEDILT